MTPKPKFFFYIDVVGACNLTCPSCPNGNMKSIENPKGFMDPDLLSKIIKKAEGECEITTVGLYNWYEPLLHPKITQLIRVVEDSGHKCHLSSNLNVLKDPESLMASEPSKLRISISGFNQSVYERTHRSGNVEKVKENMRRLAEAKSKVGAGTAIEVHYHRYLGNLDDEVQLRAFAKELGFEFTTAWAYLMPLEKVMALAGDPVDNTVIDEQDERMLEIFGMPVREALQAAQAVRHKPCVLQDSQMVLDFQGRVLLCCSSFNFQKATIARSFLDIPLAEIQMKRREHPTCAKCLAKGAHRYAICDVPGLKQMVRKRITAHYANNALIGLDDKPNWKGRVVQKLKRIFS